MFVPNIIHFLYTKAIKPILFLRRPEVMHDTFNKVGGFLWSYTLTRAVTRALFSYQNPMLHQQIVGYDFPNPVGLSAWFDKDVMLCQTMADVWFGFTEVGSITRKPYAGNPKPRLHRLKKSKGLIVYYGLKNKGIDYAIQKLRSYNNISIPVIVSVAKTNCAATADMDVGRDDYVQSIIALKDAGVGDIIDLNISCPNAFGGEDFAHPEYLAKLLHDVRAVHAHQPIFVKMPVDKPRDEFKPLIDVCLEYGVSGVIIANLTKDRSEIIEKEEIRHISGWISGLPVQAKSNALIGQTYQYCGDRLTTIGVGGIFSAEDAYEKIKHGASLVQLITGMIFEWPQLIGSINHGLTKLLKKDGYTHISEAVGAYYR